MTQVIWSQDVFSRGELSPLMYSRVTVQSYYNGMKRAKNVITFPQGAAGKRFGTVFNVILDSSITAYRNMRFFSFQYLNECTYLLVFWNDTIDIYLEAFRVNRVTTSGLATNLMSAIDTTILDARFRVTTGILPPKDLIRSAITPTTVSSFSATTLIAAGGSISTGAVVPVRFTTTGALPTTTPQIRAGRTYFALGVTNAQTFELYSTAVEARAGINKYAIASAGTGTNNIYYLNSWSFANVTFKDVPVFDFVGGYDALTFTPAAVTGYGVNLTASGPIFSTAFIGGAFSGNGGIARIIGYTSTTIVILDIVQPFDSTAAIPGRMSFLAEPAWSNTRGWPLKCSSFQSRAVFANTDLLPNGLWLSVTNDFDDFDDITDTDDDSAISYYPTSDNVNYIRFIVPYRSLTIHSNTGIYSTPLSFETALTPSNFSMSLQDSTPASEIQPRAIDNQIVILSGNDVHSMLWDGFNNSYTSTIASIANEQLIRSPHDECEYVDLNRAGSRYMFIINDDGSLTIYQTLISESVQGFTPAYLEQSYGNAYFRWAASSTEGRAWFITERQLTVANAAIQITGIIGNTFTVTASNLSATIATPWLISAATVVPTTNPQIETGVYYWAVAQSANNVNIFLTQEDALANVNQIIPINIGTAAFFKSWSLSTQFLMEELSFDAKMDCCILYDGAAVSSIGTDLLFNAQNVLINGDGFGFEAVGLGNAVAIEAHGSPVTVSEAQIGFPINVEMTLLPAAPPGALGPKGAGVVFSQHVRVISMTFADTVGGYANGTPIAMQSLTENIPGDPPVPQDGKFEMSIMKGWDEFLYPALTITHSEAFDIKLTGVFYKIEV